MESDDLLNDEDMRVLLKTAAIYKEVKSLSSGSDCPKALLQLSAAVSQAIALNDLGRAVRDAGLIIVQHDLTVRAIDTYEQNGPGNNWPKILESASGEIARAITMHAKSLGADPVAGARQ